MKKSLVISFPCHYGPKENSVLTQEQDGAGTVVCPSDGHSLIDDDTGPDEVTGTVEVRVVPGQLTFLCGSKVT